MKKKIIIMWSVFAVCVAITVALWFAMNKAELSYEEVQATVLSAKTEEVVNRKTGSRTTFYKVKAEYDGKEYELENVHSLSGYTQGRSVKAYLSNDRLFANEEGVKTSTPIATVYFVFLIGTFILLFVVATYTSKLKQKEKQAE